MLTVIPELEEFCSTFLGARSVSLQDLDLLQLSRVVDERKVVVCRDCALSPSELMSVAELLGRPSSHTLRGYEEPGFPEIMVLSNCRVDGRPVGIADAGRVWHSDSSFREKPPRYTLLHALEVPSRGGETLFIDMCGVYDRMEDDLRSVVDHAMGIFSYRPSYEAKRRQNPSRRPLTPEEEATLRDVEHPLRLVHPRTGKAALYMNEAHTIGVVGMSEPESRSTIAALLASSYYAGPDYVHEWHPNDLLIWDNRSVIHRGSPHDPGERRYIRRVSIS